LAANNFFKLFEKRPADGGTLFYLLVPSTKQIIMNELISQIVEKTGVPADKAQQVLTVVAGFVKQKFPAIGGQIDSVLGTSGGQSGSSGSSGNPLSDMGSKLGF
jgi:hypothetical protein